MSALPTGTVTFLFTDIEGSTRLLQDLGDGYRAVQDRHAEIIRRVLEAEGGHEVRTEGDSFFAAFRTPARGVRAAVAAQRGLADEAWAHGDPLRVRMGLHTGEGSLGGGDYIGIDVNRAARIAAAAHGGQVLISDATRALVGRALPEGVTVRDLGRHALKDIDEPQLLYDLVIDGLPAKFPPIRTLRGRRRTNLPSPRTSFVGREREAAEIGRLLTGTRLLTLTGPGGTGKTRLAVRVAAEQLDHVVDDVHMVDLSAVTDAALVPSSIAASLGVREERGVNLLDTLAAHLADRDLLLVLDNFEQVVEAALVVDRLLDAAPGLRILVTSRVPLHLSDEQEYLVGPMALPDAEPPDLEILRACESVKLFVERAASVHRGFSITAEHAAAIAGIVRRLDGLPLAIELAASRLKTLGPRALVERLERRLPMLTRGPRDLPERQKTLRRTIEWSHDLLESEEQRLFARLAVFRGGWDLESAEAVCGPGLKNDVLDGLGVLVDNSLVRQEPTSKGDVRFRMLETIREFAAERLAESGDRDELPRRHAEQFRDLAEEAEPSLTGEGEAEWLERLVRDHENLRAALDWAESRPDAETALRIAAAMWRFWQLSARLAEGRARLERVLALPGADVHEAPRVRALGALGGILYWQGDYEAMRDRYEQAVDIAREVGQPRLLARALFDLSFAPMTTRNFELAEPLLTEAIARAPEDDRLLQAEARAFLGWLTGLKGDDPAAGIESTEDLIAIRRDRGGRADTAEPLYRLASLKLLAGDETAWGHVRESVTVQLEHIVADAAELPSPAMPATVALAIGGASLLASHNGDHERAARLLGASSRFTDEGAGDPPPSLVEHFGDPEAAARAALGDEAFARAHAEGYAMTTDQVIAYAMEVVARPDG